MFASSSPPVLSANAAGGASFRELFAQRELLWNLTLRELRSKYKRSALGWFWSLLNPLSSIVIYSVVFGSLFKLDAPKGNPSGLSSFTLWLTCGLLPWNFFATAIGAGTGSIVGNASLIKKVAFPHEHLVLSIIVAQFVTMLIEVAVLLVALLIAGSMVLPWIPVLLVVLSLLAVFTVGLALLLASANVFFTDVGYLWTIASQLLFYASPVIWNPATVGKPWLTNIASLLPTGAFIMTVHQVVYDLSMPSPQRFAQLTLYSFGSLAIGSAVFDRLSPKFAEEL